MRRCQRIRVSHLTCLIALTLGCTSEIKIGAIVSETGAAAPYGPAIKNGIELALEQLNAQDGFRGQPIRVIFKDDATNAEAGLRAAEQLVRRDGVRIIIGAISSHVTLEIAPFCEHEQVVLLSPAASTPAITDAGEYIFRNYPSDVLEGTSMADFASDIGLARIVIFAVDNEFGRGLGQVFTRGFNGGGREVIRQFDLDTEMRPAAITAMVREVRELAPDGIYLVAYVDLQVELLRQLRAADIRAVLLSSGAITGEVVRQAGDAAENLVYAQPSFDVGSAERAVASFVKAYRERYGADPDVYAAHGYDAMRLIVVAMERTASARPDQVVRGLLDLGGFEGAAGRTAFDAQGDVVRYPRMFVVENGRAVPFETFEQQGGTLPLPLRS